MLRITTLSTESWWGVVGRVALLLGCNEVAWNARGLAGVTAQRDLQLIFQLAHPDIAVLIDTKLNETVLTKLSLKFSRYLSVSNIHLNGQWVRIWLLWDADKMQVQTSKVHAHWISIEVKHLSSGRIFSVLGVYLNPDFRIRRFQYAELNEELSSLCKPNVCLGDFNSVREMS
uniref:Endonuclease/exonuclease/phosphatase domain-containing protein n=1 Tax=Nymphaea colorata TaxID=210225 RepID=A0A5K1AQX8_9MAGN